jgi:hypothetical protein
MLVSDLSFHCRTAEMAGDSSREIAREIALGAFEVGEGYMLDLISPIEYLQRSSRESFTTFLWSYGCAAHE